ncbi:MAG TPA: dihydroorotase [Thermoclostridium caenicola]|uniref:dihydroorotase n=1 Tax=Thermoclostridium caenicola TaxID=659425 RepID=UPI002CF484FF|nr:dihydroorotase [Thermoclostridium caenicola]HOK43519.1 dihydroorotase [Thermoclostridium caenicola]HOL85114.1 dihydroorotase [Thermoclostridium caenicola]HPO77387.1 dihydroorotase [Thermoclostridium caenicola]
MKILIKHGTIITRDKTETNRDILIENGRISRIGEGINEAADQVIDATGLAVLPGLVDAHCHLRDPGYEYKEDIRTGSMSAAKGGFTSIACMPNTNPVIDNESIVRTIMDKASREGVVNIYPIGAITKGLEGNELSEMGSMKEAGIVAVSDDGRPVMQASVMKKALIYANGFGLTVISHCEDLNLAEGGSMNEGETCTRLGLHGIPSAAEDVMVSREIILSEYTGMPVHIAHVSTRGSVEMIRQAKKRGVRVTAETCPHYFTLTEKACEGYNTNAKMNPPLRTQEDVDAVIEGLRDGTIDIIATDHAPHHFDEKNVEFELAPNGIVGFETALPLALTYLVRPGILTLNQLVDKMATRPAEILKINKGDIRVGADADLVLVNLDEEYIIDPDEFLCKSKNTPFGGFRVYGRVKYTFVGGKIVYNDK